MLCPGNLMLTLTLTIPFLLNKRVSLVANMIDTSTKPTNTVLSYLYMMNNGSDILVESLLAELAVFYSAGQHFMQLI